MLDRHNEQSAVDGEARGDGDLSFVERQSLAVALYFDENSFLLIERGLLCRRSFNLVGGRSD